MNVLEERRPTLRTLCWENREETAYHTWLSVINSGEGKTYDDLKTAGRLRPSCNSKEYSLKAYVYTHHFDDDAKKSWEPEIYLWKTGPGDKLTVAQNVTKFFEIYEIRILIIGITRFTAAPYTELMIL